MIRDMRDEKQDMRNDLKIALNAQKMVKCRSWTEKMKPVQSTAHVESQGQKQPRPIP